MFSQGKGLVSENRLFHIERSKNRNLVCYDVHLADGVLDLKQPMDVYWVNQEERMGEVKGLSAIEKKFAYGYKVISKGEDSCNITLSAYPGRELTIRKEGNQYICTVIIDGQQAILDKLYVQAKGSNSLSVEYVELTGRSLQSGQLVTEKVAKNN
ncbi:MAG: DUF4833 domain-containing protein [Tannerellaceae bacterium]|nr:DUF4833 domain-containing protein [Tannerellaceae bacterium]